MNNVPIESKQGFRATPRDWGVEELISDVVVEKQPTSFVKTPMASVDQTAI